MTGSEIGTGPADRANPGVYGVKELRELSHLVLCQQRHAHEIVTKNPLAP